MTVASLGLLRVSHETLVWDLVSFQYSFVVIDEAHEVVAKVETVADFVAKTSSRVVLFETLCRLVASMANDYLHSLMVLASLESLYSFLRHPSCSFMSIRKSTS